MEDVIILQWKNGQHLTKEQQESYENAKICYICEEKFENKYVKDKKIRKMYLKTSYSFS